jgi:hypothetical protein
LRRAAEVPLGEATERVSRRGAAVDEISDAAREQRASAASPAADHMSARPPPRAKPNAAWREMRVPVSAIACPGDAFPRESLDWDAAALPNNHPMVAVALATSSTDAGSMDSPLARREVRLGSSADSNA